MQFFDSHIIYPKYFIYVCSYIVYVFADIYLVKHNFILFYEIFNFMKQLYIRKNKKKKNYVKFIICGLINHIFFMHIQMPAYTLSRHKKLHLYVYNYI